MSGPHDEDPLLESWLRRVLRPAPSEERGRLRVERIREFAGAYRAHSRERGPAWPSASGHDPAVACAWHSVRAASIMRRGTALALEALVQRPLHDSPAHADTIAGLEAETWGSFVAAFLLADLVARNESGEIEPQQRTLLDFLAPVVALATARQALASAVEVVAERREPDGGGSPGLPELVRDAFGLPLHDAESAAAAPWDAAAAPLDEGLAALMGRVSACLRGLQEPRLVAAGRRAVAAVERVALWLESGHEGDIRQAGARRLAMSLARGLELALLCEHAQWMIDQDRDRRGFAAALRFSRPPVDLLCEVDPALDRLLLGLGAGR